MLFRSMLLIEALLVLQEVPLPTWFLPYHTSYDVVTTLHRLYPAFMNGCRCITGAFYVDSKALRVDALEKLAASTREVSLRAVSIIRAIDRVDSTSKDSLLLDGEICPNDLIS